MDYYQYHGLKMIMLNHILKHSKQIQNLLLIQKYQKYMLKIIYSQQYHHMIKMMNSMLITIKLDKTLNKIQSDSID